MPDRFNETLQLAPSAHVLSEPVMQLGDNGKTMIYATQTEEVDGIFRTVPTAYTRLYSSEVEWINVLDNTPTGEYSPCVKVESHIGGMMIFYKRIRNDLPLSGFRTTLAHRKATRTIKKCLTN